MGSSGVGNLKLWYDDENAFIEKISLTCPVVTNLVYSRAEGIPDHYWYWAVARVNFIIF